MTHARRQASVFVLILAVLTALPVAAWGPAAQRAITATAIQVIRRTYSDAFKSVEHNYEEDALFGATAGYEFLNGGRPFRTYTEALAAVDNEIKLLRDVRNYGMGSYFAYRMGMLSALVADIVLPFGLEGDAENPQLKNQIEADINQRVEQFNFIPSTKTLNYVHRARDYFDSRRSFYEQNKQMISDDYRRGIGAKGLMAEGAQAFFSKSIETVADVWHTVLYMPGDGGMTSPGPNTMAWYFVDEVRYLLHQKHNFYQSTLTYKNFEKINPGLADAIEKMGDLFYAFNTTDAQTRAVEEWKKAYEIAGAERRRIGKKLAEYFIKVGEKYLARAKEDDDLPNALEAFTTALEFDQANDLAASRINETNTAITARQERRTMNVNMIAAAAKVMTQAEASNVAGDYANAIATYKQAQSLFEAVDDEFADQAASAGENVKMIQKNITDIINKVLEAATAAIDEGDKERTSRRYAEAIKCYERVPQILNVITADETTTQGKDKLDLMRMAESNIGLAREAERRDKQRAADAEKAPKPKAAAEPAPKAKS